MTKSRQEKDELIAKLTSTMTNRISQLSKFKTNFLTSLDDIATVTAKVSRSKRKALTDRNDQLRSELLTTTKTLEDKSNHFLDALKAMAADPKSDPRPLNDQIKDFLLSQRATLQALNSSLKNLDADVVTAPGANGLLK